MFKKYLFIGLIIASLQQDTFAADFRINLDARTPAPLNILDDFRATGSDPRLREREAEIVASLKKVSGRGIRPRADFEELEEAAPPQPTGVPVLTPALNLLQRLQPIEEIQSLPHVNLETVLSLLPPLLPQASEQDEQLLDNIGDIQTEGRQSPTILEVHEIIAQGAADSPPPLEYFGQDVPDAPEVEGLTEIQNVVEAPLHNEHIKAQILIPVPPEVIAVERLEPRYHTIQNPVYVESSYNSFLMQDDSSDDKIANLTESNRSFQAEPQISLASKQETEVKHAKIQTAQPVDFHGLTSHLTHTTSFRMATPMAGVAAGSEDLITYGFWASGFGTLGKQRDTLDEKRFKFIQKGIVFGADGLINENILFGVAYSNSGILRKYDTEDLMSNKQKIMSHIFSLYGSYKFDNPFYVSGQVQYGKIQLKAKRASNLNPLIYVTGKTHGQIYGGKFEAGYNFNNIEDVFIIPKVSISYNSAKLKAFSESGTGVAFTFHDAMKSNRLAGSAGIEIRKKISAKNYSIVPSVYFTVEKIISQKNGSVRISNEDLALNQMYLKTKGAKTEAFMLGGKISTYHNRGYEVDLGYDLLLQSKYQSHTGSIKFKVNF